MTSMNLLLTFDDHYTPHAGVTLYSFLANNPGKHSVYVISDYISERNQSLLRDMCASSGSTIEFCFVKKDDVKDFPIGAGTVNPSLTIATYFRLFMTSVLPKTVEKVLYLDCDIVVDGPLDGLWNTRFEEGRCIAALEESAHTVIDGCKRMGYPLSYAYFNAGVLLAHLERMRAVYSIEKASDFIRKHHVVLKYQDQDVLNAMLYDKKQFIDLEYNVMNTHLIHDVVLPARYEQQRDALLHPKIIHYASPVKPWHTESLNPFTYKYDEYLKQTPWKDEPRSSKCRSTKGKWMFALKQRTKFLLDTLHIKNYRYLTVHPKQVFVNGRFLTQQITGVNRYAYEQCRVMQEAGMPFVLVCPQGKLNPEYDLRGMEVVRFGFASSHVWAQLVLPWFFLFRKDYRLLCFTGLAPLLVRHTLMTIHDLSFLHNPAWYSKAYYHFYKLMTPVCARHAEILWTVSQASKQDILSRYPHLITKPIEAVTPRVDTTFFCRSTDKRKPFVLAVASMDPRKNLSTLVRAVSHDASISLKIAGGINRVFAETVMPQASNVEWLGRVSDEELRRLYRTAAGLVYPSLFEGYGIPPVEALACGCPVAVSDIPVLRETCDPLQKQGEKVLYFNPLDEQDIRNKIKELLQ